MSSYEADLTSSDPFDRSAAYSERGLERVESGDFEGATADFEQAELIAIQAELPDLIAAARINRGYALAEQELFDEATALYSAAADVARESGDAERLIMALANLGTAARLVNRNAEAVEAFGELLEYVAETPEFLAQVYNDRALALAALLRFDEAFLDLDEAERVARESDNAALVVLALNNRAYVSDANNDAEAALVLYQQSADEARAAGLDDPLLLALRNLAHTQRILGHHAEAHPVYEEAEELARAAEDDKWLADLLYWHGVSLREGGWADEALERWRQEEPIRRELGQEPDLADCLMAQASVVRKARDYETAERLLLEAEDICRRHEQQRGLADTLYQLGRVLRSSGRSDEARTRLAEAVEVAAAASYPEIECRARGLNAVLLAGAGDLEAASAELDIAGAMSMQLGFHKVAIRMMSRRGLLAACDGADVDEVTTPMRAAYEYAVDNKATRGARAVIRSVAKEINKLCGEEYTQALEDLDEELRLRQQETNPSGAPAPEPEPEDAPAPDAADEAPGE